MPQRGRPGHLQPLGSVNPSAPISEAEGAPPPGQFLRSYFAASSPLVMRAAIADASAVTAWTDAYLRQKLSNHDVTVEEARKTTLKTRRTTMPMDKFLRGYKHEDWHLVARLPPALAQETVLPFPLQCPGLDGAMTELMMFMAGGPTTSLLRFDTDHALHCQARGRSDFFLANTTLYDKFIDNIIDILDDSTSSVDVDRVDTNHFPKIPSIFFYKTQLKPGDCLYIPGQWLQNIRTSADSYLSFVLYLNERSMRGSLNSVVSTCRTSPDPNLTLAKVRFQFDEDRTGSAYGDGTPAWSREGRRTDVKGRTVVDVIMETLAEIQLAELNWKEDLPSVDKQFFIKTLIGKRQSTPQLKELAATLFKVVDVNKDQLFDRFDVDSKLSPKRATALEKVAQNWSQLVAKLNNGLPDLTRPLHEQNRHEVFKHRHMDEL